MIFNVRLVVFVLSALCLLAAGGCAQQSKAIAFAPQVNGLATESASQETLKDLPLRTLLDKGQQLRTQGKFELAKLYYLQALQREPEMASIHVALGDVFLEQGQYAAAADVYARALTIDPDHYPALLGAGKAKRLTGECPAAETLFLQASQLRPAQPDLLTELAICYDAEGHYSQAEDLYRQVVELRPESASPRNNLGFNLLLQGDYPQAIEAFQSALSRAANNLKVRNNLAAAYILAGQEAKGVSLFRDTVGQAGAYNNVGYIYMVQQQWEKAESAFARALELSPDYYVKAGENLDYLKTLIAEQQMLRGEQTQSSTE